MSIKRGTWTNSEGSMTLEVLRVVRYTCCLLQSG